MSKNKNPRFFILIAATCILTISLACLSSTTQELQKADSQQRSEIAPEIDAQTQPISITKEGFWQDGRTVGYAFIVKNPNLDSAFESSQYQIAAYDADGVVLETDSGFITLVLPEQSLGISGELFLDDEVGVTKVEIQLKEGSIKNIKTPQYFSVDAVTSHFDTYLPFVTGLISNPYNEDVTDIKITAILYDGDRKIIGGGYTYLNFVKANSTTGVNISVTSDGEVIFIELYPTLSGLSNFKSDSDMPSDASKLALLKSGFGQDDNSVGFGLLIENQNSDYAIERTQYQITAYSEDGNVLETEDGYINVILPNQTLGLGGDFFLEEGMKIHEIDVHFLQGDFVTSEPISNFSTENVKFLPGSYSPKVTGQIISPYNTDITYIRVSAIAYDENGNIIGGGYTFLDFIPANGKSAVEVSIVVSKPPASVELYASVTSLSDFN